MALTACLVDNTEEKCVECGMNDYLEKPIDVESLVAKINRFITCP